MSFITMMFFINIFVLGGLAAGLGFWLKARGRDILVKKTSLYQKAREKEGSLLADYVMLGSETSRLKHGLDETVELYEITREISKFLEQEKVFEVFNDKLKKYLSLGDCRLLKPHEDTSEYSGWTLFPLEIEKKSLGNLAVLGINEKDVDKFQILAQQFLLGLKRAVLYRHVQEMATLDGLTHVFTRRYWFERCNEELERSKKLSYPLSCLMIDVDRFKDFNDTYGHLVGDAILVSVAKVIKNNIRQIDLLGKYGGEEFCVILTETDAGGAQFVAERIRQALEDTSVQAYDEQLRVTVSIGVAGYPGDSPDLTGLVDKADRALYKAKDTGRNRVCVYGSAG